MGLRLFFLPNVPGATFIQGGTSIRESRVGSKKSQKRMRNVTLLLGTSEYVVLAENERFFRGLCEKAFGEESG